MRSNTNGMWSKLHVDPGCRRFRTCVKRTSINLFEHFTVQYLATTHHLCNKIATCEVTCGLFRPMFNQNTSFVQYVTYLWAFSQKREKWTLIDLCECCPIFSQSFYCMWTNRGLFRRNSEVHKRPECDTHGHLCVSFGNTAIVITSGTLILKIIVPRSILEVTWFLRAKNCRNFFFIFLKSSLQSTVSKEIIKKIVRLLANDMRWAH